MIVTYAEQLAALEAYTKQHPRTTKEEVAFHNGMEAAFKLVDKKLKEQNKEEKK